MTEHEQIFFNMNCKLCGKESDKFGNEWFEDRRFVTTADDPNKAVCGKCGFSIRLTDNEIYSKLNPKQKEIEEDDW